MKYPKCENQNGNLTRSRLRSVIVTVCTAAALMVLLFALAGCKSSAPSVQATEPVPSDTLPAPTEVTEITEPTEITVFTEPTVEETIDTTPTVPEGYLETIEGDWEAASLRDGSMSLTTNAFVFNEELKQCREMTIFMMVSMKAGTKCEDWQVWGRVDGTYQKIARIELPEGDGMTMETIEFETPVSMDAMIVTPVALGGYSWSLAFSIFDVWTVV